MSTGSSSGRNKKIKASKNKIMQLQDAHGSVNETVKTERQQRAQGKMQESWPVGFWLMDPKR